MSSLQDDPAVAGSLAGLSRFRLDFRSCLTARGDELLELADAVLCAGGPVRTLAGLSLAPEHRHGQSAPVSNGRIDAELLAVEPDPHVWLPTGRSTRT